MMSDRESEAVAGRAGLGGYPVNLLVTGLAILTIQAAGPSVVQGLGVLGGLTQAFVAVMGIVAVVMFVRFLLAPAEHRRVVASTSAKFAAMAGGTRSVSMGA